MLSGSETPLSDGWEYVEDAEKIATPLTTIIPAQEEMKTAETKEEAITTESTRPASPLKPLTTEPAVLPLAAE